MDKQPRWNPQSDTPFYPNHSSAREPDPNAVAFGRMSFDPSTYGDEPWAKSVMVEREGFLAEDDAVYRGLAPDGSFVDYIPVPVTAERIERGQERFNIFCSVCHGYEGDGKGMVANYFIAKPVNFHTDPYLDSAQRTARDGYIFSVIRNGVRNMPAYGDRVSAQDAWDIVMYVRALQRSQTASIDDVPQNERDALERERPPAQQEEPATPATNEGGSQ